MSKANDLLNVFMCRLLYELEMEMVVNHSMVSRHVLYQRRDVVRVGHSRQGWGGRGIVEVGRAYEVGGA